MPTKASYCLRIYVHVIRRSDGTGGHTVASVNESLGFLDKDFSPHAIYFQWDSVVNYIDNDRFYNSKTPNTHLSIFNVKENYHSDGIDIYLFDDSNSETYGRANGIGEKSQFFISGNYWLPSYTSLTRSHVISHEMGHVLYLFHTHHEHSPCKELVNGNNSDTCGDFVRDTPADPGMKFAVDTTTCQWIGNSKDANGDNYDPDEKIIMSYTSIYCMEYFTLGQAQRMRNAIARLSHLTSSVVDKCKGECITNLTISQDITSGNKSTRTASKSIVASNVIESNATVVYKAGGSVILVAGFHAKSGSSFSASVEACSAGSNTPPSVYPFLMTTGLPRNDQQKTAKEEVTALESDQSEMSVHPNPSKGEFSIMYAFKAENKYAVYVYNVAGQFVMSKNIDSKNSVIDLHAAGAGLYFLKFFGEGRQIGMTQILVGH